MYYTIRQAVGTEQLDKLELASSQLAAWWFCFSVRSSHLSSFTCVLAYCSYQKKIQSADLMASSSGATCWIISPVQAALLFCFPLGKCGHHHSPALQVSLVPGFEEVVQHTLVTDVYFTQRTGPSSKNQFTF